MTRVVGLLIYVLFTVSICHGATDLTIITEEFPPYNYTDEGELTGVGTRVVQEIMVRLGLSAEIAVMPWARGYKKLCSEPNVVLFTAVRTAEREPLFQWVGPLFESRMGFYAPKAKGLRIDSLEAAKKVDVIATYKDDAGEQVLKSQGFTNLDSSNSLQSNIRKLVAGRADLGFFNSISVPRIAREAGIDLDAIEEVFTYKTHHSYIAFSKQTDPAIVTQWQAALNQMKADGTFWWLARKWMPPDAILRQQDTQAAARIVLPLRLKIYAEDLPPVSYAENGRITGMCVDFVREILQRIGHPDTISMVPWARAYKLALTEPNTVLIAASQQPHRLKRFQWVGPTFQTRWGFYRWKGFPIEVKDLDGAKSVARIGTYHEDVQMQYLSSLGFGNLVPANNVVANVTHLKQGDIDLWVIANVYMPHVVRQAGESPDQLELVHAFKEDNGYIAFSNQTSPHAVRLWQAVLDDMKMDGTYTAICRKYEYHPPQSLLTPHTRTATVE